MTVSAVWPDRMVVGTVKYQTVSACKAIEIGDRVAAWQRERGRGER
jgi:hypothetical protein